MKISEYKIHDGVSKIESFCFYKCSGVIKIPDSVEELSHQSFVDSWGIETVSFSPNSKLKSLSEGCFWQIGLSYFICPPSVTYIDRNAFYSVALRSFNFSGTPVLENLTEQSFYSCKSLKSVYLPKSIKNIPESAFYSCSSLENVTVENGGKYFETLNDIVFSIDKSRLVFIRPDSKELTVFNNTQFISKGVLQSCSNLLSINIPPTNPFIIIKDFVIYNKNFSTALFSIGGINETNISDECNTLESSLFEFCANLKNVNFSDSSKVKKNFKELFPF